MIDVLWTGAFWAGLYLFTIWIVLLPVCYITIAAGPRGGVPPPAPSMTYRPLGAGRSWIGGPLGPFGRPRGPFWGPWVLFGSLGGPLGAPWPPSGALGAPLGPPPEVRIFGVVFSGLGPLGLLLDVFG